MIAATYIDASSFSVSGDQSGAFSAGRRVNANCGVDGSIYVTVQSSVVGGGGDTTVTIRESTLTSNLTEVLYSTIAAGPTGGLPAHDHTGDTQGGLFTAPLPADMTGATPSGAGTHGLVPAPAAGTATRVLQADATWVEPDVQSDASIKRLAILYG